MNLTKAQRIAFLRTGPKRHSWRALSEVICKEYPEEDQELSGNQLHGQDLCEEALLTITGFTSLSDVPDVVRVSWDM